MNLFMFFCLSMIYEVEASDMIRGKYFKIVKGKKALLNVTSTIAARSMLECGIICDSSNACTHANFRNSRCEFLLYETFGTEISFEEDARYKYICKLFFVSQLS